MYASTRSKESYTKGRHVEVSDAFCIAILDSGEAELLHLELFLVRYGELELFHVHIARCNWTVKQKSQRI